MGELKSPENSGGPADGDDINTPKSKRRRLGRTKRTPGTPVETAANTIFGYPGMEEFMREVITVPGAKLSVPKKVASGEMDVGCKSEEELQRKAFWYVHQLVVI